MSDLGPFAVKPGLFQRAPHFLDMVVRQRQGTSAYRLWGAATVNDAYGDPTDGGAGSGVGGSGPTMLLTVPKDQIARSTQAARMGAAHAGELRTGHASFQLDPDDCLPDIANDNEVTFYRVQERRASTGGWLTVAGVNNNGDAILGPIVPMPPPAFYSQPSFALAFFGIAPSNTECAAGDSPVIDETVQVPNAMHISFPRPASRLTITNLGGGSAGAADAVLLVSLDRGPMVPVPAGESLDAGGYSLMGLVTEVFLAVEDDDGGCEFMLNAGINNEAGG